MQNTNTNNFFDSAYVISLDNRLDKRERFFEQVKSKNIPFEINVFKGIDGKKCKPPFWRTEYCGHWGCFMSHFTLIQNAINEDKRNILIFEDDAAFSDDFNNILEKALNELPQNWDMLYLGGWHTKSPTEYSQHLVRSSQTINTHGYAINGKALPYVYDKILSPQEWILDCMRLRKTSDLKPWLIIDRIYELFPVYERLNVYSVNPWIVGQNQALKSDITSIVQPRVEMWNPREIKPKIRINDDVGITYHRVSWGNIGINGGLGYEDKRVELTNVPKNAEFISAHAPSRVIIETKAKLFVFGAINNDVPNIHYQMFTADSEMIGVLRHGNEKTRPKIIEPGSHILEVNTTDANSAHTVWGLLPACENMDIDSIITNNVIYPGFEIVTNAKCGRHCPGCNQSKFMSQCTDYSYGVSDAEKLVAALKKYNRKYNLVFSGGEPALWTGMDDVMAIFKASKNIVSTRLTTSCYKEDYITKVRDLFDRVCVSVRNDRPDLLRNPPEYFRGVEPWDVRTHRVGEITYSVNISCGCMNCGVTASILGDKVYPCTLAKDLEIQGKWPGLKPISLDDYISGKDYFAPIGTYYQCRTCVNNFATPSAKIELT